MVIEIILLKNRFGAFKPENELYLDWRIGEKEAEDEVFEPNKLLLEATWSAIKPYINITNEKTLSGNDRLDKIITEIPHPISDFLRKLIAGKSPGDQEDVFYNELGPDRLKYLLYTYSNCIDILAVTMLAQLWDEKSKGRIQDINPALYKELDGLFSCNFKERKTYSLLPLIIQLRVFFDENKIPYFIEEFTHLSKLFNEHGEFYEASIYLENIRGEILNVEKIDKQQANTLCKEVEKKLAVILKELGFLAKYRMASMKGVDYIKYKHNLEPKFQHNFVELLFRPSGMNLESTTKDESVDNASVIFIHAKEEGEFSYLNLSPFIIDINSFDEKAQLADLCMFLSHEPSLKAHAYRYIYKPKAFPLRIDKKKDYAAIIHEQLNAFYELIFQKSIQL